MSDSVITDGQANGTDSRSAMKKFWIEHSADCSLEEMMLDSRAEEIGRSEIPEILSLLPDITGKDVVELGAGIGRFTGTLAEKTKKVVAMDFMENFIQRNKEINGHHENTEFLQADATKMQLQSNSCDLIFSNWLLMYLTDEETRDLFTRQLSWLREGGHIFFRESCFHQSGDSHRNGNPSKYRDPASYIALYESVSVPTADGSGHYRYELVLSRSVQAYVKHKSNSNQICWLLEKVRRDGVNPTPSFQQFLDTQQYSRNGILRYERIFGKHFVSTGGKETTEEFVNMLELQKGQSVLDVGSGIGGSAFYMAEKYGVDVLGIDLSANMIAIGLERLNEIKDTRVQFEVADATKRDFAEGTFDVVYSRDTILHIPDKLALFKSFLKWLKPGGTLLISDYCCSEGEHTPIFQAYVKQRGYNLLSPKQYGKVLEEAGFVDVQAMDKTDQFVDVLHREVAKVEGNKQEFVQEFSEKDYEDIVGGWKEKVKRCNHGNQRWGLFLAKKGN